MLIQYIVLHMYLGDYVHDSGHRKNPSRANDAKEVPSCRKVPPNKKGSCKATKSIKSKFIIPKKIPTINLMNVAHSSTPWERTSYMYAACNVCVI